MTAGLMWQPETGANSQISTHQGGADGGGAADERHPVVPAGEGVRHDAGADDGGEEARRPEELGDEPPGAGVAHPRGVRRSRPGAAGGAAGPGGAGRRAEAGRFFHRAFSGGS